MLDFIRYHFFSRNKESYSQIGETYQCSPLHVYKLAHGKKPKNKRDRDILRLLCKKDIVIMMSLWEKKNNRKRYMQRFRKIPIER